MLLSFSAFDFSVSGSALCPRAAFLAISSQWLMLLLARKSEAQAPKAIPCSGFTCTKV